MIDFERIVRQARATHWTEAVHACLGPAEAYRWTVSDHSAIAPLLALPETGGRVLDVACSAGAHAFALSGVCSALYATDPDPHAVRFVRLRAQQDGVRNILPFFGQPERVFRSGSLDLVLAPNTTGPLAPLARLLKPGGTLCVGTANAHSPLTRPLGSGLSHRQLASKLKGAGLKNIRIYAAFPGHEDVRLLLDIHDSRALPGLLESRYPALGRFRALRPLLFRGLGRVAAPGFWAVADHA